ncbi:MAG: bifunctional (p)ppGpp synthetase/guanosine-3',5'-bis(diphosphate) 3'-pyrophosphohydrolase [Gemmatimonadetes bacterium]|uniref:Bifunctional (P)ppGpp synthetase/guanosine-3',5'-bis(Diphosphate) 3'-pyrophosphohydrolase n=1 Tax=Candidatus Kutchimonas denitrificans TaxID=3056748 RepID=A0AAE4Z513_9BACT|nr:bifunctional (p)ppGpp synthetase/guanosine-3',5'-bis(diphosphate) 3'-pyrophosphohydrolase [Gemmatimonadota bacterium]NIR73895.1 bifunctional (p)ppGpp synthetase/guanosine-3',5'-bis(diphosphate) 3'-pyrophosphohydrolase [Candidatus Kutchimonas denitrificans]NIR99701.1 bifunctional (p)ppGpp synthetase/guanosine-3',5'-bis(diphosphate) 3'-pyrophosphohydrolase [Gemmatimonadota bacterium]NIT65286.1 bifunctional (p)ppGpp synthetase/guanosine-3',5'-bis(diphosphate) 3'-pyrophosphohydrolase [Gemmatimona
MASERAAKTIERPGAARAPSGDGDRRALPDDFLDALGEEVERLDLDLLGRAFAYSQQAHQGQKRKSGEDYINHCVEVGKILADLYLDTQSVCAALLHDVVEDTDVGVDDVKEEFGDEIATIVDGLTKLGRVEFSSRSEAQAENFRKLLLSMARDARVIIVKLADRLHNMRTLEALPAGKRRRIARETRNIYAPLAHRLGMARIRWELEDLAFKALHPQAYKRLARAVRERRKEREGWIRALAEPLEEELKNAGIGCEVMGRPKHLWSIHKKIEKRGKPYEEIYDLMAIRVITESIKDCYHALGVIHNRWTPLTERFHDYIATPKSNMYRSLHTTIFGPGGRLYEIQIRTHEMHETAEYGIAAHWRYKEGYQGAPDEMDDKLTWFRQVLEWQQETREPEEFMEFLRIDLYQDEIFVFTPAGDVKQLPKGATPIDFAFAVHTEVGNRCAGARVNGRIAPLTRELASGDTVEIITNPKQKPSPDWLNFVRTARARNKIRQWIRQEEQKTAVKIGKEFLARELRKRRRKASEDELLEAGSTVGYHSAEALYAALGRGDVGLSQIFNQLWPDDETEETQKGSPLTRLVEQVRRGPKGVRIQGIDNVMVRYSQCCQPVPGDRVIGYITRGRGISIHRVDCPNVLKFGEHPERRIEIDWQRDSAQLYLVRLTIEGTDRRGLLSDIASAISNTGTNIQSAETEAVEGGMHGEFVVEIEDLSHLTKVIRAVRKVKGVIGVERREAVRGTDLQAEAE